MPSVKTLGIVLRHADYRDNDRMLTLLSPTHGRIDALCRGCKRPQSPLLSCSEWFALGEYVLFAGKGRMTVSACQLQDSFYPLREDYDLLTWATYMLAICEAAAQPGERAMDLFTLLTRSLSRIAYKDMDPRSVTAAFLLLFAAAMGYRPRLSHCIRCGRRLAPEDAYLMDIEEGGLCCAACGDSLSRGVRVYPHQILWMQDVLKVGIEKTACPPEDAPFPLLREYVESRLEKKIPAGRGLR